MVLEHVTTVLRMLTDTSSDLVVAAGDFLAAPGPTPDPGEVPNPPATEIPGLGTAANLFLGWGKWALRVGGVLGMFICGGMMILGRRNRSSTAVDGATGIPWVLGGLTVGSVAAAVISVIL